MLLDTFFLRHIPSYADGDFSWQKMHEAYQNELGNELGNSVQRTIVMVQNYLDGKLGKFSEDIKTKDLIVRTIYECKFDRALDLIWSKVKYLNQYIDDEKPWKLHKSGEKEKLEEVLNNQMNQIKNIAIYLKPLLPDTSEKIENIFSGNKLSVPQTTLFPRVEDITNS
jgi:methionyl-tRNA synthetase